MLSFLFVVFVTVLGAFHCASYLLWHYERCRSGSCGGRAGAVAAGPWIAEGLALAAVVVSWPFGLIGWRRSRAGCGRPVVLLHGWGLNQASMALLAARLRRDGRAVHAETLPWQSTDLAASSLALAERLRAVVESSGSSTVDIVAHGVGGVLVRAAAQSHGVGSLLGNVVTLGSPHRGTALAVLGLPAPLGELRPGSAFLDNLARGEPLSTQVNLATIASPFDAIVFPFDLAYCPGAFNVTVEGVGHFSMLYSERVYTLVTENLDLQPRPGAA
jgi:triacylglycerol lipase